LWAIEAERRVEEIRTEKVKLIDGEEVFKEIKERFSRLELSGRIESYFQNLI